jgi:hypothetical protein
MHSLKNELIEPLVSKLFRSNINVVVASSAGTSGLRHLYDVPGCSSLLLETIQPYSVSAFSNFVENRFVIGEKSIVSVDGALAMAKSALVRAKRLSLAQANGSDAPPELVGIGLSAAIRSEPIRRGQHVAYLVVASDSQVLVYETVMKKGLRARSVEEEVCGAMILDALFEHAQLSQLHSMMLTKKLLSLSSEEPISSRDISSQPVPDSDSASSELVASLDSPLQRLVDRSSIKWADDVDSVLVDGQGGLHQVANPFLAGKKALIMPGSFNPFHEGHERLSKAACNIASDKEEVVFELSIVNVDKPSLSLSEISTRISPMLKKGYKILITRCAKFLDKAKLFPGSSFVIGFDTAIRLVDPKYYNNDPDAMKRALYDLLNQGTKFYVAGRIQDSKTSTGAFQTLSNNLLPSLPTELKPMFIEIPEETFRIDISSSILRSLGPQSVQ